MNINEEAQDDEILVLQSMYLENFTNIETSSVWSRRSDKSFKLKLVARSTESITVVLCVTLTATYPKTIPLLKIEDPVNVKQKFVEDIKDALSLKTRELLGGVMIYEIAIVIEDILEEAADALASAAQLSSLEEERAVHEAQIAKLARQQEDEQAKKDQEAKAEAERKQQQKIEDELKKREQILQKRTTENETNDKEDESLVATNTATVSFDQSVTIEDMKLNEHTFRTVFMSQQMPSGPFTEVFRVSPLSKEPLAVSLILKRAKIKSDRTMKSILSLERLLEDIKTLRDANTINILAFKIQNENEMWNVDILTVFASKGSLESMLDVAEKLPVHKARLFAVELLHAMNFYHKKGIVHGLIHPRNVLFCQNASGNPVLKLADAGFGSVLHDLADSTPNRDTKTQTSGTWSSPETLTPESAEKTRKSDVWDFGVVFIEMMFGLDIKLNFNSPRTFLAHAGLSDSLEELAKDLLREDFRKRPDADDILSYEFMRAEAPLLSRTLFREGPKEKSFSEALESGRPHLHKESSMGMPNSNSRYISDWDEAGRLGKGGFGEVVKARHKHDGRFYAIKKIVQKSAAELRQVLSEVRHLARLNHPYVVRYYTAWSEEDESIAVFGSSGEVTPSLGTDSGTIESQISNFGYGTSTGGLDFISSSGYPRIEFGDDDDDCDDSSEDEGDTGSDSESLDEDLNSNQPISQEAPSRNNAEDIKFRTARPISRVPVTSTLYIQMELCEKRTLRDVIRKGVWDNQDEVWRLFRQILEGLVHIHSSGIIHRDMKPENIFIDIADNPKLGDFGLAKSPVMGLPTIHTVTNGNIIENVSDMTRSIGTTLYVAPELRSNATCHYDSKVDMYSLGIIFFEMCFPLKTVMERVHTLGMIREKQHKLPQVFQTSERVVQGEIIESLLHHRPSERPSSTDLLKSGKVPVQIEDDTIRLALEALADDSSPYYQKMMTALFSKDQYVQEQVWDSGNNHAQAIDSKFSLVQIAVRDKLVMCFRRHGAIETEIHGLTPSSGYYTSNPNVVQLLNSSGTLVQLPHDLTLPHARMIAKRGQSAEKTFTFGTVYREEAGGAPKSVGECAFDIVSYRDKDLALKEAEVVKVTEEILNEIPPLASAQMCFHISHSTLLDMILEYCRVAAPQRPMAKEILGKLNIQQWTWQRIRVELRQSSIGISSTSLDEIARFDFRDTSEKAFKKLQNIFIGTTFLPRLHEIFTHISGFMEYCKQLGVKRTIYFSPLSSFNDKFYPNGIMFQCLFDTRKRDILAAGGRYDQLVGSFRSKTAGKLQEPIVNGVGISIAWDRIVTSMIRWQNNIETTGSQFLKRSEEADAVGPWTLRRCDALVASFDKTILRTLGVKILGELWAQDISAELADDSRSAEQLYAYYRDQNHSWIIIIKHDNNTSSKSDLKVRCTDKGEYVDMRSSELLPFLRAEIRERDQRENKSIARYYHRYHNVGIGGSSSGVGSGDPTNNANDLGASDQYKNRRDMRVLMSNHKGKKWSKWRVVEAAQEKSKELTRSFANLPIASIEVRDDVLEAIRATRLSDPESWRKLIQDVPLSERHYLQEVLDLLRKMKYQHASTDEGPRFCFVFNFRSSGCILYDLKL